MSHSSPTTSRLHWACRRGMLELDLILLPFLEHRYPQLSSVQQEAFQALLNTPDPQLLSWLMGYEVADNLEWLDIITEIRSYANTPTQP